MTLGNLVFQGHLFDFLGEQLIMQGLNIFLCRKIKITNGFGMTFILLQCFKLFNIVHM